MDKLLIEEANRALTVWRLMPFPNSADAYERALQQIAYDDAFTDHMNAQEKLKQAIRASRSESKEPPHDNCTCSGEGL